MLTPHILHSLATAIAIILSGLGGGLGQGIAGFGALQAISRQSMATDKILRTMIIGLALIETGVILSLVVILMIMFSNVEQMTTGIGLAELGMAFAMGLSGMSVSLAQSFAVKSACESVARQPFFAQKIMPLMLLTQSITEAPGVFSFIIALLIKVKINADLTVVEGIKLLAAGLTIGVGSIGPSIGQAIFADSSCRAVGLKKESFGKLLTFSLLSQAVIQTPIIFCLVIAITIIFKPIAITTLPIIAAITFFSPAFAISVGSMGTAVAMGYVSSKSCRAVVLDEKNYPLFVRSSLLAQAIIESAAIYALIIALALMTRTL